MSLHRLINQLLSHGRQLHRNMISSSSLLHLRIPFSFFLLPVFLFALCVAPDINRQAALSMFVILHFLLYPASNGYNSYFDKDRHSIGGLKNPPKVTGDLYFVSLALDAIAIVWGLFIHWKLALMLLVYGLVSKAYSHPDVRLKKYPIIGWLIAGVFQGAFTALMVVVGVSEYHTIPPDPKILLAAALTTVLLWGSFPMTQVYQHQEDAARGDMTISRKMGVRGTFVFTAVVFLIANLLFLWFFLNFGSPALAKGFLIAMLPIITFFALWFFGVWRRPGLANHTNTMRLNFVSAISLNLFFCIWLVQRGAL